MGYRQVGKALDFDSSIRRFESCYPIHFYNTVSSLPLTVDGIPKQSKYLITLTQALPTQA